jgi:hypothetical protein
VKTKILAIIWEKDNTAENHINLMVKVTTDQDGYRENQIFDLSRSEYSAPVAAFPDST